MNEKRQFRFPLIALFFLMFFVAGLFSGLSISWFKEQQYEKQLRQSNENFSRVHATLTRERAQQIKNDELRLLGRLP